MAACFLPAQHHKEGRRGGCSRAINPDAAAGEAWAGGTDKGTARAGAGSWSQAGDTRTCGCRVAGCPLLRDAGPTRKGLEQLLQALCSPEVRQDSFGEPLLQTFWGAFFLISEHWSQARRSQNITKQEISLLEPVCLPYIALADWKMSLEAWALEEPDHLLWAHTASQEHHS